MHTKKFIDKCFKDGDGRVVLAQSPNVPIIAYFVLQVLRLALSGLPTIDHILQVLAFGMIFVWSWLELTQGVNYFRRALGLIVLVVVVLRTHLL
jgi:hypothetical protein